ncbi:MAG: hypothetical protein ACFCBU_07075 [Cyanophyceae cyanobacterium]
MDTLPFGLGDRLTLSDSSFSGNSGAASGTVCVVLGGTSRRRKPRNLSQGFPV